MSTPKKQATTTSTSSSKVHVVNLSSYTTPNISEVQGKDWVQYGDDNNYFQYLIDRYNGSPTNNALINGVVDFIYGEGLDATDSARKPSEYAAMKGLFNKDCVRKLVADYKMMGQCAMQVIYSKDHNTVVEVEHLPIESLRVEKCNEEGEIEGYYYAKDWDAVAQRKETPVRIPAFGTSQEGLEVLYIKPYRAGFYYYSPVDYQGGLPYAELEEEVANFHINNIQNGLAPSMLINFNNGVPSEEERRQIEMQIANKFSGTNNAGKFILAFNDNAESKATLETVQLSDAHNQYQFLSNESMQKLMVAHRITSPMLMGIKDNTGLGNNADELKTASILFENIVIKPMQETILDGINKILSYNDISLNVYFKTLQPLEFSNLVVEDTEVVEEETGIKVSEAQPVGGVTSEAQEELIQKEASYNGAQIASSLDIMRAVQEGVLTQDQAITFLVQMLQFDPAVARALFAGNSSNVITQMKSQKFKSDVPEFTHEDEHKWLELLDGVGEVINEDEWELVDERPVDYDAEQALSKYAFASTGAAFPNAKSSQDGVTDEGRRYKVRYSYAPNATKANSREFCKKMVNASKVYRKEDIERMGGQAVNAGFGPEGAATYSIWLYKGGARCHHFWMRKTYLAKAEGVTPDVGNPNAEVSVNQARRAGVDLEQNPSDVAKRPTDMPNNGFLPK